MAVLVSQWKSFQTCLSLIASRYTGAEMLLDIMITDARPKPLFHGLTFQTFICPLFPLLLSGVCSLALADTLPSESDLHCEIQVKGVISEQTFATFQNEAIRFQDEIRRMTRSSPVGAVCLDSPGGSLAIGLKMAKIIHELPLPTAVKSTATCLSACAIAFLGGTDAVGMTNFRSRVVVPGARLGFHAPALSLNGKEYSSEEMGAAYALALESISEVKKFGRRAYLSNQGTIINDFLFDKILSTPPSNFWRPTNLADYAAAEIDPSIPNDINLVAFHYLNICDLYVALFELRSDPSRLDQFNGDPLSLVLHVTEERKRNRSERSSFSEDERYAWVSGYWLGAKGTMSCRVDKGSVTSDFGVGRRLAVQLVGHDWSEDPPFNETHTGILIDFGMAPFWYAFPADIEVDDFR